MTAKNNKHCVIDQLMVNITIIDHLRVKITLTDRLVVKITLLDPIMVNTALINRLVDCPCSYVNGKDSLIDRLMVKITLIDRVSGKDYHCSSVVALSAYAVKHYCRLFERLF